MNTMTFKGYTARVEIDGRNNTLVGHLLSVRDVVCFHADDVAGLRVAFEETVTDYLQTCAQIGKPPEKPASGQSLNQWAANALEQAAQA